MIGRGTLDNPAWVRINGYRNPTAAADLEAVVEHAHGIRIPKVQTVADVRWVAERAPGKPLLCAIESARGVVNALAIASEPRVTHLALGGIDLGRDLASAAARPWTTPLPPGARVPRGGLPAPIDSVYPHLDDDAGLRREAIPAPVGAVRQIGNPPRATRRDPRGVRAGRGPLRWAREVVAAFEAASGDAIGYPAASSSTYPLPDAPDS